MKKMVICGIVICILFSLSMLFVEYSVAQETTKSPAVKKGSKLLMSTYQGPTVTISGKVDFLGYKEGQRIRINAKSSPDKGPADITFVDISQPGAYSLKVPQKIGNVYITAAVLKPGEENYSKGGLGGGHKDNPLKVGQSDIKGIDIIIKGPSLLMSTYQGPTVTISGKVDFPDYKTGQRIRINAKSFPDKGPADIAFVYISQPGAYSLKVPQGIENVYITATVLESGEKDKSKGGLGGGRKDNPLKVGQSDIKDIDIIIKKLSSLKNK